MWNLKQDKVWQTINLDIWSSSILSLNMSILPTIIPLWEFWIIWTLQITTTRTLMILRHNLFSQLERKVFQGTIYSSRTLKSCGSYGNSALFLQRSHKLKFLCTKEDSKCQVRLLTLSGPGWGLILAPPGIDHLLYFEKCRYELNLLDNFSFDLI